MMDIVVAAVINLYCRNKLRFDNKEITLHSVINLVISNVSLAAHMSSGKMSNSVT